MNNKYIIGAMVLVLVVLALFLYGRQSAIAPSGPDATSTIETGLGGAAGTGEAPVSSRTPGATSGAAAMTKGGSYIVSYAPAGFSPAVLTIKRGKSVRFLNNTMRAMSITAVDQNSQIYRELNQEQVVGKGGYYDFTFVTPGIWSYQDRNNKAYRGTIIVE